MKTILLASVLSLALATSSYASPPGTGGGSHVTGPSTGKSSAGKMQASAPAVKKKQAGPTSYLYGYYAAYYSAYASLETAIAQYYNTLGNEATAASYYRAANTYAQDAANYASTANNYASAGE